MGAKTPSYLITWFRSKFYCLGMAEFGLRMTHTGANHHGELNSWCLQSVIVDTE